MDGYINYISVYTSLSENEIICIVQNTAGFRAEVFREDQITLSCCRHLEKKSGETMARSLHRKPTGITIFS